MITLAVSEPVAVALLIWAIFCLSCALYIGARLGDLDVLAKRVDELERRTIRNQ